MALSNMLVCFSCLLAFFFKCYMAFSINKATALYMSIVKNQPGTVLGVKCQCATVMCDCDYLGHPYYLEVPFAAFLMDHSPAEYQDWSPPYNYQMDARLFKVTGDESHLRELQILPSPFADILPKFTLYHRGDNKISLPTTISYDDNGLDSWDTKWAPTVLYVVIHGWASGDTDSPVRSLRNALLLQDQHHESCLISVDWYMAAVDTYRQSAANTVVIGAHLGYLLYTLAASHRIASNNIHLIGIDMGSHVGTYAAEHYIEHVTKHNTHGVNLIVGDIVGRRTSLAPCGHYFESLARLQNAEYVDVIHTSVPDDPDDAPRISILKRQYGHEHDPDDIADGGPGQIDYYPNDGLPDNHCPDDSAYGCSLNLAIAFFKASLQNGYNRDSFQSYPYDSFQSLDHNGMAVWDGDAETETMGIDAFDERHRLGGDYRLQIKLDDVRWSAFAVGEDVQGPDCKPGPDPVTPNKGDYPGCGRRLVPEERTYKGSPAKENQYPWLVCILTPKVGYYPADYDANDNILNDGYIFRPLNEVDDVSTRLVKSGFEQGCTGSLVQPGWVLSAAHCFFHLKNGIPFYIVVGATNCDSPNEPHSRTVRRIVVNRLDSDTQTLFYYGAYPQRQPFPADKNFHDIVLIRLPEPFLPDLNLNINPICYQAAVQYPYGDCSRITIAGYGSKGTEVSVLDPRLTWIRTNVIQAGNPKHAFLRNPKYGLKINQKATFIPQLFALGNFEDHASSQGTGRDGCSGDSGGPIMDYYLSSSAAATLVGIQQAGPADCTKSKFRESRKDHDNSYAGEAPDDQIWTVSLSYGTRVGRYVSWIDQTIINAAVHATGEPDDPTNIGGILGTKPKFIIGKYDPIPVPPPDGEKSLLD